jgi:hypothetical protein
VKTQVLRLPRYAPRWLSPEPVQAFEKTPPDVQDILSKPIRNLGLKVEGSPLEDFVQKLYRELERKGVHKFRPKCYLTDEW